MPKEVSLVLRVVYTSKTPKVGRHAPCWSALPQGTRYWRPLRRTHGDTVVIGAERRCLLRGHRWRVLCSIRSHTDVKKSDRNLIDFFQQLNETAVKDWCLVNLGGKKMHVMNILKKFFHDFLFCFFYEKEHQLLFHNGRKIWRKWFSKNMDLHIRGVGENGKNAIQRQQNVKELQSPLPNTRSAKWFGHTPFLCGAVCVLHR